MMTEVERFLKDEEALRLFQREHTILEVTENLCATMARCGVTRSALAKRLGVSRGRVTQILDGANLTLDVIADVLTAMNCELQVSVVDREPTPASC